MNSTDVIVDIQGKTTTDGGVHQRHLGLTSYGPGWTRTCGGAKDDCLRCIIQTSDGGYAIAGYGDYRPTAQPPDVLLVKTYSNGTKQWDKTYGGAGDDRAYSVVQTSDRGYAIAGYTKSFGAGNGDAWLIKTDASGNVEWSKTYGGTEADSAYCLVQTHDGGYALAGNTGSFGAGGFDGWLVKTGVESGLAWTDSTADTITLYRGATDPYWNYVRVRIWKIKETP